MPIQQTTVNGKPAYRWGPKGHPYAYKRGNASSQAKAKKLALRQGMAVSSSEATVMKGYTGQGVMIAMPIPLDVAEGLGTRETAPDEMHCTLAYLGKVDTVHPDALRHALEVLRAVAGEFRPMNARLGGHGRFMASESSDGKDVMYASYDAPQLADFRQCLIDELRAAGVQLKGLAHGFTPHVTTDYLDRGEQIDPPTIPDTEWVADTVCMWIGDVRIDCPLGGDAAVQDESDETGPDASSAAAMSPGDVMALKMFGMKVVEKEGGGGFNVPGKVRIVGKDLDSMDQLVYGVVLEPDSVDGHDDTISAPDVEWSAHHFMAVQGVTGYRHRQYADATVVESYIAPCDFQMGAQLVKKGSWVLVTRVNDPDLWQQILNGEITGYSVGGFGELVPLAGEDLHPTCGLTRTSLE